MADKIERTLRPKAPSLLGWALMGCLCVNALAQDASVIFSDDFSSNEIDAAKYEAAEPFFEGGEGDIHAEAGDGVMRFVGTTTQQWWSGGTLKIREPFAASPDAPLTLSIDRVEEAGVGTARLSSVQNPSHTLLISDLAFVRNHPPIVNLQTNNLGFRHGQAHPLGRANTLFMDAHVDRFDHSQTNGIILDFKKNPPQ